MIERVNVPTLIVAHAYDKCDVSPPANAADIRAALTQAPKTEVMMFSGACRKAKKTIAWRRPPELCRHPARGDRAGCGLDQSTASED